ncbi:dihydroneopterin aldolase [Sulfurimonas marina]|uniref:dihydroneopterin aldolase n=1 Tax=Sulfurimonas marina TaxID=2590551 RepID=A0A7M1AWH2_9BACT|nr:dihydroneopterin aldolase [Sulfurimonas marina]QOP41666.1 dihydroneopterin aldolase [Sulfurimonas marina]
MKIYVEDLRFQCIIGILDFERATPQDVIVNLELEYDFQKEFINYADVASNIKKTMINEKFLLLEDAIDKISKNLQENFPTIDTLKLKITKPSILPDCVVSVEDSFHFKS